MISDLTSSFANSTGAITHDYVTVATDRYDKDVVEDYDFSGVASVGYYDQQNAVVTQSDSYKVLVCDGIGEQNGKNSLNKENADKIYEAISKEDDQAAIKSTFEEEDNRWSKDAKYTENSAAIGAWNKKLYSLSTGKLKKKDPKNLKDIYERVTSKLAGKGAQYTRWDESDGHTLPYALLDAKEGKYACVVFFTIGLYKDKSSAEEDDVKETIRIRAYGKNAKEFKKHVDDIKGDSTSVFPLKDDVKCVNKNKSGTSDYDKALNKAAKSLQLDVLQVELMKVVRDDTGPSYEDNSKRTITDKKVGNHQDYHQYFYASGNSGNAAFLKGSLFTKNGADGKVPMFSDVPTLLNAVIQSVYQSETPTMVWSDGSETVGTDTGSENNSPINGTNRSTCSKGHPGVRDPLVEIFNGNQFVEERQYKDPRGNVGTYNGIKIELDGDEQFIFPAKPGTWKDKKYSVKGKDGNGSSQGEFKVQIIDVKLHKGGNYIIGDSTGVFTSVEDYFDPDNANKLCKKCEKCKGKSNLHRLIKLKKDKELSFSITAQFKSGDKTYEAQFEGTITNKK